MPAGISGCVIPARKDSSDSNKSFRGDLRSKFWCYYGSLIEKSGFLMSHQVIVVCGGCALPVELQTQPCAINWIKVACQHVAVGTTFRDPGYGSCAMCATVQSTPCARSSTPSAVP